MYIMVSKKENRAKIHASAASYNKRKEERYIHSLTQSLGNHPGLGPQQGMTAPQQGVGTQGSNVSQRGLGPMQTTRQNQVQRIRRQEMNISAAIRTFDRDNKWITKKRRGEKVLINKLKKVLVCTILICLIFPYFYINITYAYPVDSEGNPIDQTEQLPKRN